MFTAHMQASTTELGQLITLQINPAKLAEQVVSLVLSRLD